MGRRPCCRLISRLIVRDGGSKWRCFSVLWIIPLMSSRLPFYEAGLEAWHSFDNESNTISAYAQYSSMTLVYHVFSYKVSPRAPSPRRQNSSQRSLTLATISHSSSLSHLFLYSPKPPDPSSPIQTTPSPASIPLRSDPQCTQPRHRYLKRQMRVRASCLSKVRRILAVSPLLSIMRGVLMCLSTSLEHPLPCS